MRKFSYARGKGLSLSPELAGMVDNVGSNSTLESLIFASRHGLFAS